MADKGDKGRFRAFVFRKIYRGWRHAFQRGDDGFSQICQDRHLVIRWCFMRNQIKDAEAPKSVPRRQHQRDPRIEPGTRPAFSYHRMGLEPRIFAEIRHDHRLARHYRMGAKAVVLGHPVKLDANDGLVPLGLTFNDTDVCNWTIQYLSCRVANGIENATICFGQAGNSKD